MYEYNIEGGFPVKGRVKASGNKNAALPCIAAALLTAEEVVLRNIPEIEDVQVMLDIFRNLGGSVEKAGNNTFRLQMKETPLSGIPAASIHRVPPHTDAMDEEPLDSRISDTTRMVYGNSSRSGTIGSSERRARFPCPISRRPVPMRPTSPTE